MSGTFKNRHQHSDFLCPSHPTSDAVILPCLWVLGQRVNYSLCVCVCVCVADSQLQPLCVCVYAKSLVCVCVCLSVCVYAKSLQSKSHVRLCSPVDYNLLGSTLREIRLPCPPPGDLPDPGIEQLSCISCIGRWVLYHQHHLGSPCYSTSHIYFDHKYFSITNRKQRFRKQNHGAIIVLNTVNDFSPSSNAQFGLSFSPAVSETSVPSVVQIGTHTGATRDVLLVLLLNLSRSLFCFSPTFFF